MNDLIYQISNLILEKEDIEERYQLIVALLVYIFETEDFSDNEKTNGQLLLEYLQSIENNDEELKNLYKKAIVKLKIQKPKYWENVNFSEDVNITKNGKIVSKQDLIDSKVEFLDKILFSPLLTVLKTISNKRIYADGTIEVTELYNVFKEKDISNDFHLYNPFGEKTFFPQELPQSILELYT